MLRAPIWITSAYCATASTGWASSSSVTTGSPVWSRASASIWSASTPRPLNANGDVRGLNAPPRSRHARHYVRVGGTAAHDRRGVSGHPAADVLWRIDISDDSRIVDVDVHPHLVLRVDHVMRGRAGGVRA